MGLFQSIVHKRHAVINSVHTVADGAHRGIQDHRDDVVGLHTQAVSCSSMSICVGGGESESWFTTAATVATVATVTNTMTTDNDKHTMANTLCQNTQRQRTFPLQSLQIGIDPRGGSPFAVFGCIQTSKRVHPPRTPVHAKMPPRVWQR